jgi:hypothetical protein
MGRITAAACGPFPTGQFVTTTHLDSPHSTDDGATSPLTEIRMCTIARCLLLCAFAALASPARATVPAPRAPDARRGEALYVGTTAFSAGGAPCLACHAIAGHGLARAASFGPDLSGAHAALGPDGLDSMLADIVFPSMVPVYAGRAVNAEERGDLVAFLAESSAAPPARLGAGFGAGVAAAVGLFFVGVVLVGRRGRPTRAHASSNDRRTP